MIDLDAIAAGIERRRRLCDRCGAPASAACDVGGDCNAVRCAAHCDRGTMCEHSWLPFDFDAEDQLTALVAEVRRLRAPAVHYVDWSSQADILFACGGDATQVAWGEKGEQPVRTADDGRLYAWELEHATCVACHQAVARRRRERDDAAAADAPARMARIMERERERESLAALRAAVRELAAADARVCTDEPAEGAAFARRAALRALFALVPEVKP